MIKIPQQTSNYQVWTDLERKLPDSASMQEKIAFALNALVCASSSHNSQPWSVKVEGSEVWLIPDLLRRLPSSDPTDRELYLSLGAGLANFEVAANHLNLASEIEITPANHIKLTLSPSKTVLPNLYPAIAQRVNYDGPHQPTPLPPEVLADFQKIFASQPDIQLKLVSDQPTKTAIGDLVTKGDQAIFSSPDFTAELVRHLRDAATLRKDGIPTSALGLPPHLRRMAAQIFLSAKPEQITAMASQDGQKVAASTAIGVIYSRNDTPPSWISAGKLYQLTALTAASHGVYLGARAVLIETADLHQDLAKLLGIPPARPLVMFRAGYPTETTLFHTPRYPSQERLAPAVPLDRPTIFKLDEKLSLAKLQEQLGDIQIESLAYFEHYLPDLFSVQNPTPDPAKLAEFIAGRSADTCGVWAYYPTSRKLVHLPDEDDFYQIITANNSRIISEAAQKRLREARFGIAGLSGSGAEAALAIAMSGAKHLRLADHDYLSARNKGRVTGQTGENKTWNLAWRLWEHNPFLDLDLYPEGITKHNVTRFAAGLDLLLEQTDSGSKFLLRDAASGLLIQVTDLENPAVELERDKKPIFGGRAAAGGITAETMGNIRSAAESTWYIAQLIGPNNLTIGNWNNFTDIVEGRANAYSQIFISVQAGGGAVGRLIVAWADDKIDQLPDSWLVHTLPVLPEDPALLKQARDAFYAAYSSKFPPKT